MPFEKGHPPYKAKQFMAEPTQGEVTVRRFDLGDIDRMGMWMIQRLRKVFPEADDRMIIGWLRACILSNEHFFVCTENAVGLAIMSREPLHTTPIVDEIFVLCRDGAVHEGVEIYKEMKRWTGNLGARRCQVRTDGDVSREKIKQAFGTLYIYEVVYGKP
jgi:hypothetical protein